MNLTAMKELPEAAVYEEGLRYWPYKASLELVLEKVVELAPKRGRVIDLMCGTGYLLGELSKRRPDLLLYGVDIDERYVEFARGACRSVTFSTGNILELPTGIPCDIVLCTGALHHITYEEQEHAILRFALQVRKRGHCIIADSYVDEYRTEEERKLAAAKLGHEYLCATVKNGGHGKVLEWTADITRNDVLMHEYKTSLNARLAILRKYFREVDTIKTWPATFSVFGDYVSICSL